MEPFTPRGRSLLLGFAAILGGLLFLYIWEKQKRVVPEPTGLEQIEKRHPTLFPTPR